MDINVVNQLIAENISRLMGERDINATVLAERASLNRTAVYDIIAGRSKSPRVQTVASLAYALGVPLSDMFLTKAQIDGQAELLSAYQSLPEAEQSRLSQIAHAWLPDT